MYEGNYTAECGDGAVKTAVEAISVWAATWVGLYEIRLLVEEEPCIRPLAYILHCAAFVVAGDVVVVPAHNFENRMRIGPGAFQGCREERRWLSAGDGVLLVKQEERHARNSDGPRPPHVSLNRLSIGIAVQRAAHFSGVQANLDCQPP